MRVLGIDVGTSSIKAAVIDVDRAEIVGAISNVPYRLEHPSPEAAHDGGRGRWSPAGREACRGVQRGGGDGSCRGRGRR